MTTYFGLAPGARSGQADFYNRGSLTHAVQTETEEHLAWRHATNAHLPGSLRQPLEAAVEVLFSGRDGTTVMNGNLPHHLWHINGDPGLRVENQLQIWLVLSQLLHRK